LKGEDQAMTQPGSRFLREANYIGGQWLEAARWIDVFDPASGERVGAVPNFGKSEAETAVSAACAALPDWQSRLARDRASILRRWAELIMANGCELSSLLTREQGKPLAEARAEIAQTAAFLEWFAEEGRRVVGELIAPHAADRRLVVSRQPIGIVGAITPWNFPMAMIGRKVAPALAAGCAIVVKPSELTPFSSLALAALGEEAGVPPGVFNVVTGDPSEIGKVLTTDPRVRKFTFTGSTHVGKLLAAQCASTVKRVSLELGGNAPFLVFDDADLDDAVEGAIASKFRNSGQTCVCANRFLVQVPVYRQFAEKLAARVKKMTVGPGLAGSFDQGPLINAAALDKMREHVRDALQNGGVLLAGGEAAPAGGLFFRPTVISDVSPGALLCREETFGPLAGLVPFETEDEAVRIANETATGLAAYVFTRNAGRQWRMMDKLEYGMVGINTGLISTEVAPFGGLKESGIGREGARQGIDEYLEMKFACIAI